MLEVLLRYVRRIRDSTPMRLVRYGPAGPCQLHTAAVGLAARGWTTHFQVGRVNCQSSSLVGRVRQLEFDESGIETKAQERARMGRLNNNKAGPVSDQSFCWRKRRVLGERGDTRGSGIGTSVGER